MSHTIETQADTVIEKTSKLPGVAANNFGKPRNLGLQDNHNVQHHCTCYLNSKGTYANKSTLPSQSERIIQGRSEDHLLIIEGNRRLTDSSSRKLSQSSTASGDSLENISINIRTTKKCDQEGVPGVREKITPRKKMSDDGLPEVLPEEVMSNGIRSPSIDGASDRPEEDDHNSVDSLEAIDEVKAPWESHDSLDRINEEEAGENRSRSSSVAYSIGSGHFSSKDSQTSETFPIHQNEFNYGSAPSKLPVPTSPCGEKTVSDKRGSKLPPVRLTRTSSMRESKTVNNANASPFVRTGSLRETRSAPRTNVSSKIDSKRVVPRPAPSNNDAKPISTAAAPRETTAVKKRNEKIQAKANQVKLDDSYMTPMQRKDQNLKDLKAELKETKRQLEERELRLESFNASTDVRIRQMTQEKDDLIAGLEISQKDLEERYNKVSKAYGETLTVIEHLEETVNEMKEEMERRDKKHQDMYFEMFERGKATAEKERIDELEKIAEDEPDSVGRQELIDKLKNTEDALERWRNLQRQAAYEEAEKPDTEAGATLRFLKDSMFHYVTNAKDSEQHLRAMINIFKYTDVQQKSITKSLQERKKGKKSKP